MGRTPASSEGGGPYSPQAGGVAGEVGQAVVQCPSPGISGVCQLLLERAEVLVTWKLRITLEMSGTWREGESSPPREETVTKKPVLVNCRAVL